MRERRWKLVAVLAAGIAIGVVMIGTPASAHVGGTVNHLWNHLKPKADKRYDRPTVKPGETIRGTVGTQVQTASTGELGVNGQLPRAAPVGLDDGHVEVAGVDGSPAECPGSSTNPTAAPGFLCIYPYSTLNANANEGALWGSGDGTRWGFQVSIDKPGAGAMAYWFANWAYRAPTGASPRIVARPGDGCSQVGQAGC
jgi:hypothetical protein